MATLAINGIEERLAKGFFVRRRDIMQAFVLTRPQFETLAVDGRRLTAEGKKAATAAGKFVAEYLEGDTYARFVRSQVLAAAKRWEGAE